MLYQCAWTKALQTVIQVSDVKCWKYNCPSCHYDDGHHSYLSLSQYREETYCAVIVKQSESFEDFLLWIFLTLTQQKDNIIITTTNSSLQPTLAAKWAHHFSCHHLKKFIEIDCTWKRQNITVTKHWSRRHPSLACIYLIHPCQCLLSSCESLLS